MTRFINDKSAFKESIPDHDGIFSLRIAFGMLLVSKDFQFIMHLL